MAVAKSYENCQQVGEPYERDGKMYVVVKGTCPRCGGSGHYSMNAMGDTTCYRCCGKGFEKKEVRWYTESQRAALDRAAERRAEVAAAKREERRIKWSDRNAFGFREAGYITIFKGEYEDIAAWSRETSPCRARYATHLGWYVPSDQPIENLPDTITPIKLTWDEVRDESDEENLLMKNHDEVKAYVGTLTHEPSVSQYQGEIGDWLQKNVTVKRNIEFANGRYGDSHMHIMEDEDKNVYVWSTASKNYSEGSVLNLRMKVKDHQEYNNTKQTIVYYCKVK